MRSNFLGIRIFGRGICFAGPGGGGGSAKTNALGALVEANRFLNCGRIKEGVAILETATLEKINKGFIRDDFPLVLKLVSVYQASGFGDLSPVRKEALGAILLQASDTADKLSAIAKEDPNKLTAAEKFHVGAGFSTEAAPAKIEEFAITVSRLIEKLDSPIEAKPVEQKPAPVVVTPIPTIAPVASTPAPKKPITPPAPKPAPKPALPVEAKKVEAPKPIPAPAPKPVPAPVPSVPPVEAKKQEAPVPSPSPAPTPTPAAQPIERTPQERVSIAIRSGLGQLGNKCYKDAVPLFKQALTIDPSSVDAQDGLDACAAGLIALAEKQIASTQLTRLTSAATFLKQAKEANPKDPNVLKRIEEVQRILTPGTAAKPAATSKPVAEPASDEKISLATIPSESSALIDFIFACAKDDSRTNEMLIACIRLLDKAERNRIAYAQLGWWFFKRDQFDEANVLFTHVLNKWPDDKAALAGSSAISGRIDADEFEPLRLNEVIRRARAIYASLTGEKEVEAPIRTAPVNPQAQKLLAEAVYLLSVNINHALEKLLEANKIETNNPDILAELEKLFILFKNRAIDRKDTDKATATHACKQALKIKPEDSELSALLAELTKPVPVGPKPAPLTPIIRKAAASSVVPPAAPLPSGPAPLTPKERLQRILDIMKRKYHEKGYAWIIKTYEEYPKTIGNNVPTLCYYLFARLAAKFPLLLDFDRQRFSSIKDNNIKTALRFLGRLERMLRALEFLAANKDKNALETMSIDPQAYNLLYNTRKIMQISEARVAVGIIQDPETEARLARELKEEFDKVIGLEVVIESSAERKARLEKEQKETARLEKEKLRQRVLQYFIDHPNAKTPFEEWLWYALYREGHRVFNGAKEAKRLALEEISRRKKEVGQQEVIEFLRKHPGITTTELLASHSHILNLLYNKDLFPGGIKEARALAEEEDI